MYKQQRKTKQLMYKKKVNLKIVEWSGMDFVEVNPHAQDQMQPKFYRGLCTYTPNY